MQEEEGEAFYVDDIVTVSCACDARRAIRPDTLQSVRTRTTACPSYLFQARLVLTFAKRRLRNLPTKTSPSKAFAKTSNQSHLPKTNVPPHRFVFPGRFASPRRFSPGRFAPCFLEKLAGAKLRNSGSLDFFQTVELCFL